MKGFIEQPKKIPLLMRFGIWISEKITGKDLLIAKLLSWYPKAAIGSGLLEALIAHNDKTLSERILKLVRMQTSFAAACPFCVDMNSFHSDKYNITTEEIKTLQDFSDPNLISSFSERECLAIEYAKYISKSPLSFPEEFIDKLKKSFNPREIVILASTGAQVNYWARLIQALGVPPAGFSDKCDIDI